MYKILKYSGLLLLTGCFFFGFLYFWSDVLKPDLEEEPIYYSPEEIEFTENSRDVSFTEDEVFKIQEDVDYSEGKSGRWYPKSESPLLSELVDEGKLPPVAERVGFEPVQTVHSLSLNCILIPLIVILKHLMRFIKCTQMQTNTAK